MVVDANEDVGFAFDVAMNEGEMSAAVGAALIADGAEFAVGSAEVAGRVALDELFGLDAVADEIGDRDHFKAVLFAEFDKLRNAGHGSVFVHDFADDAA